MNQTPKFFQIFVKFNKTALYVLIDLSYNIVKRSLNKLSKVLIGFVFQVSYSPRGGSIQ